MIWRSLRSIAASWLLLIAAGCATAAKYDARLDEWVGHDADELIAAWGPPTSSRSTPSGDAMLTWSTARTFTSPVPPKAIRNVSATEVAASRIRSRTFGCTTTFTIDASGRVSDWQWRGNRCESEKRRPAGDDSGS